MVGVSYKKRCFNYLGFVETELIQHDIKDMTMGLILRAFRDDRISKEDAITKIKKLYVDSSLFITKDLIDQVINSINEFEKQG